ncbi:hypothetical protein PTSG_04566 [Salpingoeca rosetta]|uniref:Uncharacterized protein n=1 Tax=Salpingoeca rosetta (strain ATCC 50818 / BSB-021) TaxID=946362 RepID=F2U7T2_SALR5|nr:uncharacterized protein PTSG_04566 [Salpingoeca rosetta]EGD72837.1 hypothetical protein PTSG_04566 [Salpingoeca rosetta]|eukprot:XP_004994660.1 hypothetical protein PTSG_04566 [Salpingoeca rosetta]
MGTDVPETLTSDREATAAAILELTEEAEPLLSKEDASEETRGQQQRLCAAIAEVCKDEEARAKLTASPALMQSVHETLSAACAQEALPVVVQCLRAIGNMCFDNDAARQALRSTNGVAALGTALQVIVRHAARASENQQDQQQPQPQVQLMAGPGSILNAAGESEELQKELVEAGVVDNLMWLLSNAPTEQEKDMALNALMRFTPVEKAMQQLATTTHLSTLISRLEACSDVEDADSLGELLKQITNNDKNLPAFAEDPALIHRLMALAQVGAGAADEVPITRARVVAAGVVAVLLSDDACLAVLWGNDKHRDELLTALRSWMEPALATSAAKQRAEHAGEAVAGEAAQSENQGSQALQPRPHAGEGEEVSPLAALSDPAMRQVVDKAVAGLIGIGNICRSDDNARVLGETPGLLPALVALSTHNLGFVQHAALGALNNVVKLKDNRNKAVDAGAVDALLRVMNDPQAPLQYLACSSLRILSSADSRDLHTRVATDTDVLHRIIHLTGSEVMAARGEAMRLLVTVVKTGRAAEIIAPIVTGGAVDVFVRMLQEEHPLFKCEGMIGLAVASAAGDECEQLLLANDGAPLTAAMDQVQQTEMVELGLNFLAALTQLIQNRGAAVTALPVTQRAATFARERLRLVPEPAVQAQVRQFLSLIDAGDDNK